MRFAMIDIFTVNMMLEQKSKSEMTVWVAVVYSLRCVSGWKFDVEVGGCNDHEHGGREAYIELQEFYLLLCYNHIADSVHSVPVKALFYG